MAKKNGDPYGVVEAARNDKYNGQIATAKGPKTMAPIKDHSSVDKDYYQSKPVPAEKG